MQNTRKTLVITILVIVLAIVLFIIGDLFARNSAQNKADEAIANIPGVEFEKKKVDVRGWPFIPQAVSGKLSDVRMSADAMNFTVEGANIRIQNPQMNIKGFTTKEPFVADSMTGSGMVTIDSLQNLVTAQGLRMQVSSQNEQIRLTADIVGVPVTVTLNARADNTTSADLTRTVPAIVLTPVDVTLNIEKLYGKSSSQNEANKKDEQDQDKNKEGENKDQDKNAEADKQDQGNKQPNSISLGNILDNFAAPSLTIPLEQSPNNLQISTLEVKDNGIYFTLEGVQLNFSEIGSGALTQGQAAEPDAAPQDEENADTDTNTDTKTDTK
ncbi:MAG: LmeA family phospholipid-binding protein [Coriobacteriia bacterium]|nr:LmeA family phospholipid-binding protein [Coriobacteriia bacterium]